MTEIPYFSSREKHKNFIRPKIEGFPQIDKVVLSSATEITSEKVISVSPVKQYKQREEKLPNSLK